VSSGKITVKDALEEIIPALQAAGLTDGQIRDWSAATRRIVGHGGTTHEWLMAGGKATVPFGERAQRAYLLALNALTRPKNQSRNQSQTSRESPDEPGR
jgi:hypothetical protein